VQRKANKYERYAARFAAKEAGMKALGTGWSHGVRWQDFEVANLPSGRPTLKLHGRRGGDRGAAGVKNVHLSLTHTAEMAQARNPGRLAHLGRRGRAVPAAALAQARHFGSRHLSELEHVHLHGAIQRHGTGREHDVMQRAHVAGSARAWRRSRPHSTPRPAAVR